MVIQKVAIADKNISIEMENLSKSIADIYAKEGVTKEVLELNLRLDTLVNKTQKRYSKVYIV